MDYLQIGEGSEVILQLDLENNQLLISSAKPHMITRVDQEFSRQVSKFIEHYRSALDELAE